MTQDFFRGIAFVAGLYALLALVTAISTLF